MAMAMAAAAAAMVFLVFAPCLAQAEERPTAAHPHGLPFESPLALSPDAYEFFHPASAPGAARRRGAPALSPRRRRAAAEGVRGERGEADQEEGGVAPARKVRRGCARAGTVAGVVAGAAAVAALRRSRWRTPWGGAAWAWRRTATPRRARAAPKTSA